MAKPIRVGITQGDHNGIGLEIVLKALNPDTVTELFTPVVFADWRLMEEARKTLGLEMHSMKRLEKTSDVRPGQINVIDLHLPDIRIEPGIPTATSGAGAEASLDKATEALMAGDIDVLVTAPISKEAIQSDTFKFAGHTEYLESKAGEGHKARMILFDDKMRVALVTTHVPISKLTEEITQEKVAQAIRDFSSSLTRDFTVTRPKIAVLSLNPHVGDGGLLGTEENEIIKPAIEESINQGILAFGPYSADGFFGSGSYKNFDGILAMYHDQGLAPFKALGGGEGVNFTAGLPFVRTSPDHGTGYDIAWKGEADPQSMREAIYRAIDIYRNRKRHEEAASNPLKKQITERPQKGDRSRSDKEITTEENNDPQN